MTNGVCSVRHTAPGGLYTRRRALPALPQRDADEPPAARAPDAHVAPHAPAGAGGRARFGECSPDLMTRHIADVKIAPGFFSSLIGAACIGGERTGRDGPVPLARRRVGGLHYHGSMAGFNAP
jgi:hypothetical protein